MDVINDLQTDDSTVTDRDRYAINMIFNKRKNTQNYNKNILIASLLFFVLSLPFVDTLIEKYIKLTSLYYKLAVKTTLFIVLYFLVNYSLKN